jgi:hypothetical protein
VYGMKSIFSHGVTFGRTLNAVPTLDSRPCNGIKVLVEHGMNSDSS